MYRVLMGNNGKVADATYKAGSAMKRGMLVVKGTDGTVNFSSAATDANVFFVGKEFITSGIDGDRDLPDYNAAFEDIAEDEPVVTEKPVAGEQYFIDQTTGDITKDGYVKVGTDGKLAAVSTGTSKFIVKQTDYVDCGTHAGIVIEVLD